MHLIAHVIYGMIIFRISSSRVLRSNRTDTFRGATFILKKKRAYMSCVPVVNVILLFRLIKSRNLPRILPRHNIYHIYGVAAIASRPFDALNVIEAAANRG